MDPAMLDVCAKLGFGGLALWLIYDTRQEARKREDRMAAALDQAQADVVKVGERGAIAMETMTEATCKLAEVLDGKPCLAKDRPAKQAVDKYLKEA